MNERLEIRELLSSCRLALKLTAVQRRTLARLEESIGQYTSSDELMLATWGEVRGPSNLSDLIWRLGAKLRRFGIDVENRRGVGWTLVLVRVVRPWMAEQSDGISPLLRERRA